MNIVENANVAPSASADVAEVSSAGTTTKPTKGEATPLGITDMTTVMTIRSMLSSPRKLSWHPSFPQSQLRDNVSYTGCRGTSMFTYNTMSRTFIVSRSARQPDVVGAPLDRINRMFGSSGDSVQSTVESSDDTAPVSNHSSGGDGDPGWWYGTSATYSDILPVNIVSVRCIPHAGMTSTNYPVTSLYQEMLKILSMSKAPEIMNAEDCGRLMPDISSMLSLTVWLNDQRYLSPCEEAAVLRLACLTLSVDPYVYKYDPNKYQFIRRAQKSPDPGFHLRICEKQRAYPVCKICVVPIDVAIGLRSGNDEQVFSSANMDISWQMVPMATAAAQSTFIIPYIAAFMTSNLWAGRINTYTNMTWGDADWKTHRTGTIGAMPRVNSTRIPGPCNIMLVLADQRSPYCPTQISIGGVSIPVSLTSIKTVTNFTDIWLTWFTNANLSHRMPCDLDRALREMCEVFAVNETCGTAFALAAEMYGGWFSGMHMDITSAANPYMHPADGAWAYNHSTEDNPNTIDAKNGAFLVNDWEDVEDKTHTTGDLPDNVASRRRMAGFNFASHTSLHRLVTGSVTTQHLLKTSTKKEGQIDRKILDRIEVTWSNDDVAGFGGYNVNYTCSFTRLCIVMSLIDINKQTYYGGPTSGFTSWIHMVSMTMAGSTLAMLLKNDIGLRQWVGLYPRDLDNTTVSYNTANIVKFVTDNKVVSCPLPNLKVATKDHWSWDNLLLDYMNIDIKKNQFYMYHSGVPVTFCVQWAKKMEIGSRNTCYGGAPFAVEINESIWGIKIAHDMDLVKTLLPASIDIMKYIPIVRCQLLNQSMEIVSQVVDQWSYISRADLDPSVSAADHLAIITNTFIPNVQTYCPYTSRRSRAPNLWVVEGSFLAYRNSEHYGLMCSDLRIP